MLFPCEKYQSSNGFCLEYKDLKTKYRSSEQNYALKRSHLKTKAKRPAHCLRKEPQQNLKESYISMYKYP